MSEKANQFKSIAVMAHPQVERAIVEAAQMVSYLHSLGLQADSGFLNDESLRRRVQAGEFDLLVTLGGDGTVLRAAHLCAPYNIPMLPVNMGSLGFLIEVRPPEWQKVVERLVSGDYRFEDRMMLYAGVIRREKLLASWDVLNDVVIARAADLRPVHLRTSLDGQAVTTYVADALIVSTPTGSTAYALATGGPILPPDLRNILLVPVAPHLSIDRAIVLAKGSKVSVTVISDHGGVVSGDGQTPFALEQGDRVEVRVSEYVTRFVRLQPAGYFYANLVTLMDQNPSAGV